MRARAVVPAVLAGGAIALSTPGAIRGAAAQRDATSWVDATASGFLADGTHVQVGIQQRTDQTGGPRTHLWAIVVGPAGVAQVGQCEVPEGFFSLRRNGAALSVDVPAPGLPCQVSPGPLRLELRFRRLPGESTNSRAVGEYVVDGVRSHVQYHSFSWDGELSGSVGGHSVSSLPAEVRSTQEERVRH